jgi:PAS domain S-box-containing protein
MSQVNQKQTNPPTVQPNTTLAAPRRAKPAARRPGTALLPDGIQERLFLLIALTLLPMLLLMAWIYHQDYQTSRAQALQSEMEVARGIAATFSTFIEGVQHQNLVIGQALASSHLDEDQIQNLLTSTATQIRPIRNLHWADAKGKVIASSYRGVVDFEIGGYSFFRQIREGATHTVGNLMHRGFVANIPTISIATAIRDQEGALQGVLVAALEPDLLSDFIFTHERPSGGGYAIFDHHGVVVYTSSGNVRTWGERVGWQEGDVILKRVLETGQAQSGIEMLGNPGVSYVVARVPMPETGYIAGARRLESVALAAVQRSLLQSALVSLLVWSLAFLFALLMARTISRPIHTLARDAQALGRGEKVTEPDVDAPGEVRRLHETVGQMAGALIVRAEELRQQAEALRQSESRFRVMFHNRHSPMLLIDPTDGQIVDANLAAADYYGWPQETLQAMKIGQINQLASAQVRAELGHAMASQGSQQFHFRHSLASGEIRDVEVRSGPIQIQEKTYLLSTIQDITDRLQAERDLRERSEGLALLSDASRELLRGGDPLALLDHIYPRLSALLALDGYIHYRISNDGSHLQLASLAGVLEPFRSRLERLNFGEAVCGFAASARRPVIVHDVQKSQDPSTKLIQSMGINAYACHPMVIQDQLVGTLSFASRARTEFDPQAINLMRTTTDLLAAAIHRRNAEAELQLYATRLEESNQNLQDFAFVASHDLQEPLRKIEMFGERVLEESENLDPTHQDYLERMNNAASRMRRMIMDLLTLSRVNTQGRPFEEVDLAQTAADVLSDLELQIYRTKGQVVLEDLPTVRADPAQMHQLLQNLIGNSLKYHRPGLPPRVIVSGSAAPGGRAEIRIQDNGIGFEPSEADRIFQPFQRLVARNEYEGSGMGLAICRKIVERHQGKIEVNSTPGEGSTFIITLPQ